MADRQQRMSTQSVSWEVEETDDPISGRITQVDESTIKLPARRGRGGGGPRGGGAGAGGRSVRSLN